MEIGLIHPGEMGAAIGAALTGRGHAVCWASAGRSVETANRADSAGMIDVVDVTAIRSRAEVVISVCPPHAAANVTEQFRGFDGLYLDANAISPETSTTIAADIDRYVDGGIVGPPPRQAGTTRLYLSGPEALAIAELFDGTILEPVVLSPRIGNASALKMVYAAWTKGSAALLLATLAAARADGVESALVTEWKRSQPALASMSDQSARSALTKGWRWTAEMREIAATFAAAGVPDGFHLAAAEIYDRIPRESPGDDPLGQALTALLADR